MGLPQFETKKRYRREDNEADYEVKLTEVGNTDHDQTLYQVGGRKIMKDEEGGAGYVETFSEKPENIEEEVEKAFRALKAKEPRTPTETAEGPSGSCS